MSDTFEEITVPVPRLVRWSCAACDAWSEGPEDSVVYFAEQHAFTHTQPQPEIAPEPEPVVDVSQVGTPEPAPAEEGPDDVPE